MLNKITLLIIFFFCFFSAKQSNAQLQPGDLAIIGVNADTRPTPTFPFEAEIAFVSLVDIPSGTTIFITDEFYREGGLGFLMSSADSQLTWLLTQAVPKGTVFSIKYKNDPNNPVISPSQYGSVTKLGGTNPSIRPIDGNGDSWLMYTKNPDNSLNFIYGFINTNYIPTDKYDVSTGWFTVGGAPIKTQSSNLPTQLIGTNAYNTLVSIPGGLNLHHDYYYYKGVFTGTKTELLNKIKDPLNWTGVDDPTTTKTLTPGQANGAFSGTQPIYTITEGPIVTSVSTTASAGVKGRFVDIPVTITFSENVTVTGSPRIKLAVVSTAFATYQSGSGGKNLLFSYTTFDGDYSTDLDYENVNSLSLNGGTIKSATNQDAILTLPAPGTPNALGGRGISVDVLAPTVSSVNTTTANGSYTTGKVIPVTVNFSEAVTVTGTPTLLLNTSSTPLNYLSGSGTSTLAFEYTVLAGQSTAALNYTNTAALALNGGTIRDAAANVATLTLPNTTIGLTGPSGKASIIIDTTSPTVTSVSGTNGTYKIASIVPISVNFSEPITVTGTPLLALTVGSPAGNASYASGSGTNTLTFNYTVAAGQSATDLDYTGTTALSLNGGTLKDAAGNNATLTLASPGAAGSLAANSSIVINGTPPTITSIVRAGGAAALTKANAVNFTVTFSEAVNGVDLTDFVLISTGIASPTITSLTGSGTTYTVTVNTGTGSGTLRLDLNAAGTQIVGTSSGNAIQTGYTAGQAYTVDKTVPTIPVLTINSNNTNTALAKTGDRVRLFIYASEVLNPLTVTMNGHPVTAALQTSSFYTADYIVTSTDPEGPVTFTINYSDEVGNVGTQMTATSNATKVVVDNLPTTIAAVTSTATNGPHGIGTLIPISVTFSEPVAVTGTPTLALNSGAVASYVSGTGTTVLNFNYTVAPGQSSTALDYSSSTALSLSGGSIIDQTGAAAGLTLPAPGAVGSLANGRSIVINGIAPTVLSILRKTPLDARTNATSVQFEVTFSEAVSGIRLSDFAIRSGSVSGASITGVAGSGATYIVTVNTGTGSGSAAIDLNASGTNIVNSVSNPIQTGYTSGEAYTVDKTSASFSSVLFSSNNEVGANLAKKGDIATLLFQANEGVRTPVVTIGGQTVVATALPSPPNGANTWRATYTFDGTEADGSKGFVINLTDVAGNTTLPRTTVLPGINHTIFYDKTPPTLTAVAFSSDYPANPAVAVAGSIVTLKFTASEGINASSLALTIAGSPVTPIPDGTNMVKATYTVPSVVTDGIIPFTINFYDRVGNDLVQVTNVTSGKNVTVDGIAPTLTSVTMASTLTNTKLAKSGTTVTTSFTASEPITGTIVRIGGTLTAGTLSNNNTTWTAGTLINAGSPEGPLSLSIDFQDLAGNAATTVTSTTDGIPVVVDNTPPTTMAGPIVTAGDQQNVLTWTASPTANSYKIYGGTTFPIPSTVFQTVNGSTLTYIHTGLINGSTYYYAITAVDEAGNESVKSVTTSGTPSVSQTITFTAPGAKVYGSSFDLTASSTSLLPVTFTSSNSAIASVSGNTVTIVGVGAVNITASQAGNANFGAAAPVTYPLQITPLPVTVAAMASSKVFGSPEPISFGFSISPALIGNDAKSGALTRTPGEDAGNYEIGIGTFALDPLKYTINYTPANFSISKKTVTISPVVNTKVFNQSDPTLSFMIDIPGVPVTGALTRTAGENVGSYAYSISGMTVGSNYQLALNPTPKFSITPLTINVTASATTKAYGDADPVLAYTPSPALKSGDVFTGALARAAGESVGTYALNQGDLALSSNYNLNFITPVNTFSITKKTITVVPVAVAKVYGEPIVPATYTYSPALAIGDSFTGSLTVPTAGPAGDHDFNIGTLALSSNYTLAFAPAAIKYSISKKPLTITPDANQGRVFGATALPITYTHSALASGDVLTGELAIAGGTNAGDHAITLGTLSMADGKIINYEVSLATENYNISQKAIVITAASPSKTYGDADPTLTYTSSAAPIAPDAFTGTLGRAPGTNVGSYAINLGNLALNNNYTLTLTPGAALEIVKKDIAVLAAAKSKVYGGTDPELTYTSSPTLVTGDTFSGALSRAVGEDVGAYVIGKGDLALSSNYNLNYTPANLTIGLQTINVTAKAKTKIYGEADPDLEYDFTPALKSGDTFSGALARAAGENVGSYVIGKGDLALSTNYTLNYTPANLTIGLQTINVTAKAKTKIYGEADPAFDYDFTPALKSGDVFTGELSRAAGENVNTYVIGKGDLALNSNYILNYTPANLTIGQQTIEVSAKAKTKVYGEADPALDYEFSPALKSGDIFTGSLSRAAGETVNTYVIGKGDLALNSNYILNYTPANLTITLKTINVTAKAKTKVYGETDPALDYDFMPALKSGDSFTGALSRTTGETVNTYAIGKGNLALNSNYILNYTPANLTITLKTINVTAKAKTKVYGEADPAFDYDVLPALQPGDTFTGALSRTAGTHIGNYVIGQGNLALNANYTLAYTPANLSITPKTIAVQAVATSKTYGSADPLLTYNVTPDLVNGDALTGALTRINGENKGTYAISKGSLASSADYSLSFTGADFTINAAPLTITAEAKEKFTGTANPAFTAQYTGYVNGEGNAVLTTPVVFNTPATINSPIGTYDIIPSGATAANYSITFVKGVLTVKAGSPTNVSLAAATLYENQVSGTPAGKLSSTSDDPLATFTYSLVSGTGDTDNASFRIAGDQLLTAASLDYETKKVYSVKVRSTTQHGFSLDKTFSINLSDVNEIPTLDAIASKTICYTTTTQTIDLTGISAGPEAEQKTTITASGSNAALLQSLTVVPGAGGKAVLSYRVKNGAAGTSTITVTVKDDGGTDNGGVDTYSRTFVLTVNPLPVIAINANIGSNNNSSSTDVSKGETLVLTASGGSTYVWAVHNSIISGQTSASLTVRPRETTTYTVTVTNANGCSEQKTFTVNVLDDLVKIKATNILTPNGDGYNDKWIIENIDFYPNNEVKIFDKAGRMVYGKRSYDNSWDGMLNGMPLAEGTYYYVIDFGKDRPKFKGFITIVREN